MFLFYYFTVSSCLMSIALCLDPPDCDVRNDDPCEGITASGESLAQMLLNIHNHLCGCVYVTGNIHIVVPNTFPDLDAPLSESNFSFFYHIREVYDYVYIQGIPEVNRISFPNLRIIRGESLFGSKQYALVVFLSDIHNLYMPQLTEITKGNVRFREDTATSVPSTCNILSVNWDDIMSNNLILTTDLDKCTDQYKLNCSTTLGCNYCWCNDSVEQCCQDLTRDCSGCSNRCHRVVNDYGPIATQCCDSVCAAGCDGGEPNQCRACRLGHILNDDTCESSCPPPTILQGGVIVANPDFRFRIEGLCVLPCPRGTFELTSIGECVEQCPAGMMSVSSETGGMKCVECDSSYCKECVGGDSEGIPDNCTLILGTLRISNPPPSVTSDEALGKLSTIHTIRGALSIEKLTFNHFPYLSNLKYVGTDVSEVSSFPCNGGERNPYSIFISENENLVSIDFSSLKSINGGGVSIDRNPNLCIIGNLSLFVNSSSADICLGNNYRGSMNECVANNHTCHPECNQEDGCWVAQSDTHCVSCLHYHYNGRCVHTCSDFNDLGEHLYGNPYNECSLCHEFCTGPCYGMGSTNCSSCRSELFVRISDNIIQCLNDSCPEDTYKSRQIHSDGAAECLPCSSDCTTGSGCNGPLGIISESEGCKMCDTVLLDYNGEQTANCTHDDTCPTIGYYSNTLSPLMSNATRVCSPCYKYCSACIGPGVTNCTGCRTGFTLRNMECVLTNATEPISGGLKVWEYSIIALVAACLLLIFIFITALLCVIFYCKPKKKTSLEIDTAHNNAYHYSSQEAKELTSSITKPFMTSSLKIIPAEVLISHDRLTLLESIGQGEFGVVYRAILMDKSTEITVAVKTIKGDYDKSELNSLLEESLLMRGISHSNVMELIGISIDGDTPYIILPFMEGGPLLKYLRKNKDTLFVSHATTTTNVQKVQIKLLEICLQIAQGMKHLAKLGIIHRDLAARNCMLDSRLRVKVADFGLSKGLYDKVYFRQQKNESVKLPIKWLAIESIEYGVFTVKSDVWAYGVTCWEVFSCGKIPYGGIPSINVLEFLKTDQRMEKPDNAACSSEIFNELMFNCWKTSPDERPIFIQIVKYLENKVTELHLATTITTAVADDDHIYI